jgi:hypothetical protein
MRGHLVGRLPTFASGEERLSLLPVTGVWSVMTGPGCGLSEVLTTGDRLAALDDRAAPTCPPGPVTSRLSVPNRSGP